MNTLLIFYVKFILSITAAIVKNWTLFPPSIQTLVKVSKTAGPRLKPHASRLIPALLEALSTLEPQVLNYLSLRATEQEKVTLTGTVSLLQWISH